MAKRLVDGSVVSIGILTVAVPNHLLSSICELHGDDWRRVVWSCRRYDPKPNDLRYVDTYQWLVGPIGAQSTNAVERMQDMSELCLLKLPHGETAQQYFAANDSIIDLLDEQCVGKVWVELVEGRGAK